MLTAIDDRIADGAEVKAVLVEAPFDELPELPVPVALGANLLHALSYARACGNRQDA